MRTYALGMDIGKGGGLALCMREDDRAFISPLPGAEIHIYFVDPDIARQEDSR